MPWLIFFGSSALLVFAATKLAQYGDAIAARTGLGRLFVGTLLLAGATSLPELLTTINAFSQGVPELAAGNLMGSNMFNMLLLAVLDVVGRQVRILRRVALKHALTASLATLLIGMAAFFILADVDITIGHVGVDSLLLIATYIIGVRLIQSNNAAAGETPLEPEDLAGVPRLWVALLGFGGATLILVLVSPWLVSSSKQIAELTGLGTGFVGTALVAVVTSLPEVATSIAAVRLGAYDLAIGNLFGITPMTEVTQWTAKVGDVVSVPCPIFSAGVRRSEPAAFRPTRPGTGVSGCPSRGSSRPPAGGGGPQSSSTSLRQQRSRR